MGGTTSHPQICSRLARRHAGVGVFNLSSCRESQRLRAASFCARILSRVDVVIVISRRVTNQKSLGRDTVVLNPTVHLVRVWLFSYVGIDLVEGPLRWSCLVWKHRGRSRIVGNDVDVAKSVLTCVSKA